MNYIVLCSLNVHTRANSMLSKDLVILRSSIKLCYSPTHDCKLISWMIYFQDIACSTYTHNKHFVILQYCSLINEKNNKNK